ARVYGTYLKFVSKDDIHVYSVDEAFLDVTCYISSQKLSPREMASRILDSIFEETGIRATCGIGSNLYLAKIALDITAKHSPDFIGMLNEETYAESMWSHRPLTDFWRIGRGTANKLARYGIMTMGDIASADEDFLYRLFGIDAELLIDHAWGREPTTIADIKAYKSKSHCLTSGQVLMRDYSFCEAKTIVHEMTELMCLDMVDKGVTTDSISLCVGYSNSLHLDPAKGSARLDCHSNADRVIIPAMVALYERIVSRDTPIRRLIIACGNIITEQCTQLNLFDEIDDSLKRSREVQRTMLRIKKRFGKNALFRALDLTEGATTLERNRQIGGHKSGE
ncbi:MAG: DNA repair protein, partial [Clostridia bacterium]|nr:DNA repair protein [Clostridia bacterium]